MNSLDLTVPVSFVEHNLLGVGLELSMEAEVVHAGQFPGQSKRQVHEREEEEGRGAGDETETRSEEEVVHETALNGFVGLARLVQEEAVLAGHDAVEVSVVIGAVGGAVEEGLGDAEDEAVLEATNIVSKIYLKYLH